MRKLILLFLVLSLFVLVLYRLRSLEAPVAIAPVGLHSVVSPAVSFVGDPPKVWSAVFVGPVFEVCMATLEVAKRDFYAMKIEDTGAGFYPDKQLYCVVLFGELSGQRQGVQYLGPMFMVALRDFGTQTKMVLGTVKAEDGTSFAYENGGRIARQFFRLVEAELENQN